MFSPAQQARLMENAKRYGVTPDNCPHCEYDRRFPGFQTGGWMDPGNNAPIVACPNCNADASHPRE